MPNRLFPRCGLLAGIFGAFLLVTLLLYGASLRNDFVTWDDGLLIFENPIIRGISLANLKAAFTSYDPELYIPLTFVSYQFNFLMGGLHPFLYHFTNLVLHAFNAFLVALVVTKLSKRDAAGLFAGLLFAVHPLNVEVVVWASARKDVLSSCFFLLSILAYFSFRENRKKTWYVWSLIAFLLGLLAKVSVITLPIALLLVDWYEGRKLTVRTLMEKVPYFLLSAVFGVVALSGKIANGSFLKEKFLIACKAIMFYVEKFFWPSGLSVLYPYTKSIGFLTPDLLVSWILVLLITITVIVAFLRWRVRLPLFVWLLYVLLLIPSFNTVAKGRNELLDVYFASDRYAYLAQIGLLLCAGIAFDALRKRIQWHAWGFAAVLLTVLSIVTIRQSLVWENTKTLFMHVLTVYPDSYVAHVNVGEELYKEGKTQEALYEFGHALEIRDDAVAYEDTGRIFLEQGRLDAAKLAFEKAIESSPLAIDAYVELAKLFHKSGSVAEEMKVLEAAASQPNATADVFRRLGDAYEAMNRTTDAAEAYEKARR